MSCLRICWASLLVTGCFVARPHDGHAAEPIDSDKATPAATPLDPRGIRGALLIHGGGPISKADQSRFRKLAASSTDNGKAESKEKQSRARIVIGVFQSDQPLTEEVVQNRAALRKFYSNDETCEVTETVLPPTVTAKELDEFRQALRKSTGVWLLGEAAGIDNLPRKDWRLLQQVLDRQGVVAVSGDVATRIGTQTSPDNKDSMNLLPDSRVLVESVQPAERNAAVIDWQIPRETSVLIGSTLELLPRNAQLRFGGGNLDRGRTVFVAGPAAVTVRLPASELRRASRTRYAVDSIIDLTSLRRALHNRTGDDFPPTAPVAPIVKQGALVIIGGGGMPRDVTKRIVDLAGGPDAKIVVLPTASPDRFARRAGTPFFFRQAGARNIVVLPQSRRSEVTSPEFLEQIRSADCVWFGGGRQWRFVDAYADTPVVDAFHEVLRRGGVIAGSSAGASIQGDYLARANPLGNLDIMAEGYERGFNFLPGTAIDQHFAQRKRFRDLQSLVKRYPQFLGIGLDEATAIVVQKSTAEVMGRGDAHFYKLADETFQQDRLSAGARYDLLQRTPVAPMPARAEQPAD